MRTIDNFLLYVMIPKIIKYDYYKLTNNSFMSPYQSYKQYISDGLPEIHSYDLSDDVILPMFMMKVYGDRKMFMDERILKLIEREYIKIVSNNQIVVKSYSDKGLSVNNVYFIKYL